MTSLLLPIQHLPNYTIRDIRNASNFSQSLAVDELPSFTKLTTSWNVVNYPLNKKHPSCDECYRVFSYSSKTL